LNQTGGREILRPLLLFLLFLFSLVASVHPVAAYAPQKGDYFRYSETATINNGQGSYSGYSDQTSTTGMEEIKSVNGSDVLSNYSYTYNFSNNQGNSTSGSKSGEFTWSTSSHTYVNGTDNQVGYTEPTYVWFAMDPSLPAGGSFSALNTHLTILSKNYSLQLPTEGGQYVRAVEAEGTGQYQRDDSYGVFSATYTWYEYFDPTTGYIIGYNYTEQDTGTFQGQAGSFTYSDTLYVTSTSYPLAAASAVSTTSTVTGEASPFPYLAVIVWVTVGVLLVAVVALALRRRRKGSSLPEHPPSPPPPTVPPPPPAPWESKVDLGSKPTEQVVIREVAKVNCKYCGTLIPTTVDRCPYCGAPRE